MREILFKAKRIDNGEWVEGFYVKTAEASYIVVPYSQADISGAEASNIEVDENTICQYTGLTDKNGCKIWENDIVKKHFYTDYDAFANSEEYIGVLEFEDCAWVIKTKNNTHVCTILIIESLAYSHDVEYFEVIGNVFDNKDLLES